MKTVFLTIAILLCLWGCSEKDLYEPVPEPTPTPTPETPTDKDPAEYIVSFGFSGEITNITEEPLSRAATDDVYGIQVHSIPEQGGNSKPYAYGVFEGKSNITIRLLEGYKYSFTSTMIVNGKNKLSFYTNGYNFPFYVNGRVYPGSFTYSTNDYMSYLNKGTTTLSANSTSYYRPNVERFYGVTSDYKPTESGTVDINMKRVSFGINITAEGLTEGELQITIPEAPPITITYPETTYKDIFTFWNSNYNQDWTSDSHSEKVVLAINWKKADGAIVPLVSREIEFKRNILTNIIVSVKDNSQSNGLNINNETGSLGDGGTIRIESGEGVDTGVNPTN